MCLSDPILTTIDNVSKVAFIILSLSTTEASHWGLMRQFELYAIIAPTYNTHIRRYMPSECYFVSVHLIPGQASQRLSMVRYATLTITEIRPLIQQIRKCLENVINFLKNVLLTHKCWYDQMMSWNYSDNSVISVDDARRLLWGKKDR